MTLYIKCANCGRLFSPLQALCPECGKKRDVSWGVWDTDETIEVDGKLRPSVTALRNDVLTLRGIVDKQKEQLAAKDAEIDAANKRAENQWFLKVERSGDYVRAVEERDIALATCTELAEKPTFEYTFVTDSQTFTCNGCGEIIVPPAVHACNMRKIK